MHWAVRCRPTEGRSPYNDFFLGQKVRKGETLIMDKYAFAISSISLSVADLQVLRHQLRDYLYDIGG
jgi:hypothetical protein